MWTPFGVLFFASVRLAQCDLRQVFKQRTCLQGRQPLYPFKEGYRQWVLEVNAWTSQRLVSSIAAILLGEVLGYSVDLNLIESTAEVRRRISLNFQDGDGQTVKELREKNHKFGYINMEVWPAAGSRVEQEAIVVGDVGYFGRNGLYIDSTIAHDSAYTYPGDYYRAYGPATSPFMQALRADSEVSCVQACCCSIRTPSCLAQANGTWCPSRDPPTRPSILADRSNSFQGLLNSKTNYGHFEFGVKYLEETEFTRTAFDVLRQHRSQVIHWWRPSLFSAQLSFNGMSAERVLLPSENCGENTSFYPCEFPIVTLAKMASKTTNDPVAKKLLDSFTIPQGSRASNMTAAAGQRLAGAGIDDLMNLLVQQVGASFRPEREDEIFNAACQWVQANEHAGVHWDSWIKKRKAPFFADTRFVLYPLPTLVTVLLIAGAWVLFLELPWLHTTLSPKALRELRQRHHCDPHKAQQWRSELETRLRENQKNDISETKVDVQKLDSISIEPSECGLSYDYYFGPEGRMLNSVEGPLFWPRVEESNTDQQLQNKSNSVVLVPPWEDFCYFAHHTFPCFQDQGEVTIPICRSQAGVTSKQQLVLQVEVEECDGGAKKGKDFEFGTHEITFKTGESCAMLRIPITHHKDTWQNSYAFQARISSVQKGTAKLFSPACAKVLVLDNDMWPANLREEQRGGHGISLMRRFVHEGRLRRGEKWTKTMLAMLWIPIHSVVITTMIQKILVDHILTEIQTGSGNVTWNYGAVLFLGCVQLFSLGLMRWADVVQTRNRGRTGGFRQTYRLAMLKKFMQLEHTEHWLASEGQWLYSAIYDTDIITGKAYYAVFILAQSCFALILSILLVLSLSVWSHARTDSGGGPFEVFHHIGYVIGILLVIPLCLFAVWNRRKLTWMTVVARKESESHWTIALTKMITEWRHYWGLCDAERQLMEKRMDKLNKHFLPTHWDARDTMNDTTWLPVWIQNIAYCVLLIFGCYELIEAQVYGIGSMEVGTFYALAKVYLHVGKYSAKLSSVFVDMQQAVVSLREVAALLNQTDQGSMRMEAVAWKKRVDEYKPDTGITWSDWTRSAAAIIYEKDVCLLRPRHNKKGATFGEFRLATKLELPLGKVVHVTAENDRVLNAFLAMAAQVAFPTNLEGGRPSAGDPRVLAPYGLRLSMIPMIPTPASEAVGEQLRLTGAPEQLCRKLANACGLNFKMDTASLAMSSKQILAIIRAILLDPDVLCASRSLDMVPVNMQRRISSLLRCWQHGGLPRIATLLDVPMEEPKAIRPLSRTLIVGNCTEFLQNRVSGDVHIELELYLWKPSREAENNEEENGHLRSKVREEENGHLRSKVREDCWHHAEHLVSLLKPWVQKKHPAAY